MSSRSLPSRPSLKQLKRQAKELHAAHRGGQPSAGARVGAHHPERKGVSLEDVLSRPLSLADAQLVIAREYGFVNWTALKLRVELGEQLAAFTPHPRFDDAIAAMDAGDIDALRALLEADHSLLHARTNLDPPYHYFTGATLLHHVAGNPDRGRLDGRRPPLPPNIADIARLLLDVGADVHAVTLGPNGGDTMGLLVTSKQASDADVVGPLIDALLAHGATLDLTRTDVLDASLANHAPRAAEKMIALGAKPDILAAAALGRMELLRGFFDDSGRLTQRPRRRGHELSDRDAIGLAALYAYVRDQKNVVEYLLEHDANWNMTGVNNGTLLHRAAWSGDLPMIQRLAQKGADVNNRDNPFGGTPLDWAWHNEKADVVAWLTQNVRLDAHAAVEFDLSDQLAARLREDPSAATVRVDDGTIPDGTPLHAAARLNREALAGMLLANGADPDALAGNGQTPLDVADAHGAEAVAAVIEAHGGTRAARSKPVPQPTLASFETLTEDIVRAYDTGDPEAMASIQSAFGNIDWQRLRGDLQRNLDKPSDGVITVAEVRDLFAQKRGFQDWSELAANMALPESESTSKRRAKSWALPPFQVDGERGQVDVRTDLTGSDWNAILAVIADRRLTALNARGQMTDALIEQVVRLGFITHLDLAGSKRFTDAGMRHLSRLPNLADLDLSGAGVTDNGLAVLRELLQLKRLSMHWHRDVSDRGMAHLANCNRLEWLDLMGTNTGDGTLKALAGKSFLRHLRAGNGVTERGLALLHDIPSFKRWQHGAIEYGLMDFHAAPTYLQLVVLSPSRRALDRLVGLDGLFALNIDNPTWKAVDVQPLSTLSNLGWLGHDADDESMQSIGQLQKLRMLMAQDTEAGDNGFEALSRSPTIEYIWGRRCYNLRGRGFTALSRMPSLAGLSVSCKNVGDGALATLPTFPALTAFMPMDIEDEGFRHVARCERLESLWLMYCRTTTDVATEHLGALPRLRNYYAGSTQITDRSLEILGRIPSLERLTFWGCNGITSAGAAHLASLPNLREVSFDDCKHITTEITALFPPHVRLKVPFS